jgi:hypothetical protein
MAIVGTGVSRASSIVVDHDQTSVKTGPPVREHPVAVQEFVRRERFNEIVREPLTLPTGERGRSHVVLNPDDALRAGASAGLDEHRIAIARGEVRQVTGQFQGRVWDDGQAGHVEQAFHH